MEYKFNEWHVELIQEPNKLLKKLKNLNIKGKKLRKLILLYIAMI